LAAIYALAVASPGPGVAAILARALGHGLSGMGFFIAGFLLGDFVLLLLAATGLAMLVQAYAQLLVLIKLAGAAYLLVLAWKLWRALPNGPHDPVVQKPANSPWGLFLASFSLTVGNPKAIIFFMAILPTIVDLRTIGPLTVVEIAGVMSAILPGILGGYALAADRARRLFRDGKSIRVLNRTTALVMAGAAAAVARS
jgi:threonine/homoserine/homoserine lactone efflux protein